MSYRALFAYATVFLVAGCSDTERVLPPPSNSVGSVVTSVLQAPVSSEASPVVLPTELGCSGSRADPPEDFTVFFDAVALPTSDHYPTALQTGAQGEYSPDRAGRLFAKTGLWFKPGHAFELIVPDELRDRLSIGWSAQRSWRVAVAECDGVASDWVVLPGGYWVADPLCAELIVRSGDGERHVNIGLGAPCPGQAPPPQPSDV